MKRLWELSWEEVQVLLLAGFWVILRVSALVRKARSQKNLHVHILGREIVLLNKKSLTPLESEEIQAHVESDILKTINLTSFSNQEKQDLLKKVLLEIAGEEQGVDTNGNSRI